MPRGTDHSATARCHRGRVFVRRRCACMPRAYMKHTLPPVPKPHSSRGPRPNVVTSACLRTHFLNHMHLCTRSAVLISCLSAFTFGKAASSRHDDRSHSEPRRGPPAQRP
eukprot:scaffold4455_cov132-Isochrysis_galbana.AAC.3